MSEAVLSAPGVCVGRPTASALPPVIVSRFSLLLMVCLGVFLLRPSPVPAAPYLPAVDITIGNPVIALGESAWSYVSDASTFWLTANSVTSRWTGSDYSYTHDWSTGPYVAGGNFVGVTPGVFDVITILDWSNHPDNSTEDPLACHVTNILAGVITVVAVTNVTTTTHHMAAGGTPVTLTAHMAPISVPDKVSWSFAPELGGGNLFANGLTAQFPGDGNWPTVTVRTTCGTSRHDTVINVYHLIGITASSSLVAAGEPITLTAITDPPNCPLPITWNISTNTGATITNTFGPGTHRVIASLGAGTITQTLNVVSVGVKEILYEWPANSENWLPWTNQLLSLGVPCMPVGETFRVKAMPEPEGAEFPAGWPQWGGAASGSGAIATASYGIVSTNSSDYQPLTAICGTSSRTEQALVFRIDSILVATNHVAIGTNTLALTAEISPSGIPVAEYLVGWECTNATLTLGSGAGVDFPCNQSGIFTITATCGSSSVATNIYVYRVTGLTASANPVAVGETNVGFTAIVEPAGCPLPLVWSGNGVVNTNVSALSVSANCYVIGMEVFEVGLGTSTASVDMWTVGIKDLYYLDPQTGQWADAGGLSHELVGSAFPMGVTRDPLDSPAWPAGWPTWNGTGVTVSVSATQASYAHANFGTLSLTTSDHKAVVAKCGTSSKSANTIAFKMELKCVPAETWPGRVEPNEFGLGETVVVSNSVTPLGLTVMAAGVVYTPASNGYSGSGSMAGWDGMAGTLTQVSEPEVIPFGLYKRGAWISAKTVSFIAPEQVEYVPLSTNLFEGEVGDEVVLPAGPFKEANSWKIGKRYHVFIKPAHVSFTAMEYAEEEVFLAPDSMTDQGRIRDEWGFNAIGLPILFVGGPVGLRTISFNPNPSMAALTNGFIQGSQTASVPLRCRVPTREPGVFKMYSVGSATFEGNYFGYSPNAIQFKWRTDTVNGTYSNPLPSTTSP